MRPDEQRHLVEILARGARELDVARERLLGRPVPEEPAHEPLAAIESVTKRVRDVEHELHEDLERRRRRTPARALGQWTSPRLGMLRHHPPVPLQVPMRYLRTNPPAEPPSISIVTPSYQQGRYLERAIYSVVSQSYPALEYLVQDAGSTDGTREVLERFSAALSSWESEPDGGQAEALNRAFARTGGEIMAYLNSDDMLLPGSLAYVARYLAAHPDVDVVYGHRVMVDELDRQIGRWALPSHDEEILAVSDYIPQETLFWRRSIWERAGGHFDESFDFAMDWDLLLRMRAEGAKMVRLPRYLGAFRVHAEQKTVREQSRCRAESARLQQRELGRSLIDEEVFARSQAFLRRHVLHHTLHGLLARVPEPRVTVRTRPLDAAEVAAAVRA